MTDIDNDMRSVLLAVRNLNDDKEKWFEALCRNYREIDGTDDEVAKLVEAMRGTGRESRDIEALEQVLKDLSGKAWDTVGKLVQKDRDLPGLYAEAARPKAAAQATAAAPREDVTKLGWVLPTQETVLEGLEDATDATRGPWSTWLPAKLDGWWSVWRDGRAEQLTKVLNDYLPTLGAPPDVREFQWVTPQQRDTLKQLKPDGWQAWLTARMDKSWQGWAQNKASTLVGWLTPQLDAALAARAAKQAAATSTVAAQPAEAPTADLPVDETPDVFDPDALTWVTPAQRERLEGLTDRLGIWETWLPADLTKSVPGWRDMTQEDLTDRLDTLLNFYELPMSEVEAVAVETLSVDLVERLRTDPDMADFFADSSEEELTQAFAETFADSPA